MKITKIIETTIEIEEAEKKLLAIEYKELSKLLNRKSTNDDEDKFSTIHEIIQNLLM